MTDKRQEKPPEKNTYSGIFWGKHLYTVRSRPMCNVNDEEGCSVEFVKQMMLKRRSYVTPSSQADPVNDGDVTDIPGLGPVKHTVSKDAPSVKNTTQPEHLLHPGTVERRVEQESDGNIVIVTSGSGDGLLPGANVKLAPYVWSGPDERLRQEVQENLKKKDH